jgi:serine/threonine protein kinase
VPRPPDPPTQAGPYTLLGEIGRGGMAEVHEALDHELDRRVAVKVLSEEHRHEIDLRRRFLKEARITGHLQHPGVAPVYRLGHLADQRPFFTMKLIRGQTLQELLRARTSPGEDLLHLLGIFEQVCQAVAYAHSRGIIHRDLKPSNIMVGAFGEVQVMDWGLAKVLTPNAEGCERSDGSEPARQEPPFATPSPGSTEMGAIVGTLGYLAPEQARGEIDRLDERCDVFGLGAMLCEILTGQLPFPGPTRLDYASQAAAGNLSHARTALAASGADPELVRLTLACLEPDRQARLRDAAEVAGALAAYRAGVQERLRQAELARAQAQARAERERHARRLTLALAASLLAITLLGGGGAMYLYQRNRLDDAERHFRRAIQLDPHFPIAHHNLGIVMRDRGRFDEALARFDRALALDPRFAGAHPHRGQVLLQQKKQYEGAAAALRRAAELDPSRTLSHSTLAHAYHLLGKKEEAEASFARALTAKPHPAVALADMGHFLLLQGKPAEALPFLQEAYRQQPNRREAAGNLAVALVRVRNLAEAERMFHRVVSLEPNDALAWCELARLRCQLGMFAEALEAARKGHELGRKIPSWSHPSEQWVKINESCVRWDRELTAYQRGEGKPKGPNALKLAKFSERYKKPPATTASLYAIVLAEWPDLADVVENAWRYNAACHAVQAASKDKSTRLGARERSRWRKQALTWLRADLAVWEKRLAGKKPGSPKAVLHRVGQWLTDADLASVRDLGALARLPAGERDVWVELWKDVAALLARAGQRGS